MKAIFGSPEYQAHEAEIESLAQLLNITAESTGANGGVIIGALTMLLAIWLDHAPENVRNEIREKVVKVLQGRDDA